MAAWLGGSLADSRGARGILYVHADDFYPSGRVTGRDRTAGLIRHGWELVQSGAGAE